MARKPKPWYWNARKAWFVTIDGTRHRLAADKKAAHIRFHELMAKPERRVVRSDSLAVLIDLFLDWCQKHRAPDTFEWYRYRLERFVQTYPDLRTDELRPFHVQQWIDAMTGLSSGSHLNHCRSIKRALRWCRQQGYIDINPIADMELPRGGKRETVISAEEFARIREFVSNAAFDDLVTVTWETGCRPQESLRVEARHVDLKSNRWVFPASEAKGDVVRIVYLTDKAAAMTRRLCARNPSGPLFRNANGTRWMKDAVNSNFVRLQHRLGLSVMEQAGEDVSDSEIELLKRTLAPTRVVEGRRVAKTDRGLYLEARTKLRRKRAQAFAPKYSLYTLRHSWATHALERGVDALTVAVLMGHRDPTTLAKVYQHLTHNPKYLLEQARKAAG